MSLEDRVSGAVGFSCTSGIGWLVVFNVSLPNAQVNRRAQPVLVEPDVKYYVMDVVHADLLATVQSIIKEGYEA